MVVASAVLAAFWVFLQWKAFLAFRYDTPHGRIWGVADDAYISADFGRTLAGGGGPRWYAGAPKVEGFSSPLWMLLMAVIHLVPGLGGPRLGLTVFFVNALVVVAIARVVVSAMVTVASEVATLNATLAVGVPVAALSGMGLTYWGANGFEVPLVALLSLSAFHEAFRPDAPARGTRGTRVGVITAIAVWARLDSLVYCSVPLAFSVLPPRGQGRLRPRSVLIVGASLAVQTLVRVWYYGDWLPNTYYLKATGWPLADRVLQGWIQSSPPISPLLLVIAPAAGLILPRVSSATAARVGAALSVFALSVIYATQLGGDLAPEEFGYDRFTSVGALFLAVGLPGLWFAGFSPSLPGRLAAGVLAVATAAAPVFVRPNLPDCRFHLRGFPVAHFFNPRSSLLGTDTLTLIWIQFGLGLHELTKPGARVAVCAAGATIYFSEREGIDILGKIDRRVARLPVPSTPPPEARCWRGFPGAGHNKEDVPGSFRLEEPDAALVQPPRADAKRFVLRSHEGLPYWIRRRSPFVHWGAFARR